jgi:hypothetical protein
MNKMQKNKIGIIIPYFGNLPNYFPFFLKGCEFNTDIIDIHFIHDREITFDLPDNVIQHKISLSEINKLATDKTGLNININNPYKLCDFKPVYGHIFENILESYEFWGYGDIDIIYGDLSKFFSELNLIKYDLFTFREYIISGALTVMRNNNYFKHLYKKSPQINQIFLNEKYCGFDEAAEKIAFCRKRTPAFSLFEIDNIICWSSIVQKEFYDGNLNLYSKYELIEAISFNCIYTFSNGELCMGMDEFVAYHLVTEKRISRFVIPDWKVIPDNFYITPTGFYKRINIFYSIISGYRYIKYKADIFKKRIKESIIYRLKLKK